MPQIEQIEFVNHPACNTPQSAATRQCHLEIHKYTNTYTDTDKNLTEWICKLDNATQRCKYKQIQTQIQIKMQIQQTWNLKNCSSNQLWHMKPPCL